MTCEPRVVAILPTLQASNYWYLCVNYLLWWRGLKKNLELSSGGWAPCSIGFPSEVSVVGTHLYPCTSWWCCEKLCSASVNFFRRLFQCICPFHDGWFTSTSDRTVLSVQQFLTKNSMTPMFHLPHSPHLTPRNFFFVFLGVKSPQRKTCCWCGRSETKNGRSTKRHQNQRVQRLFGAVEKMSWQVYCIKWRVLWRWLKFKHVRISTQFLINKFWVLGGYPIIHLRLMILPWRPGLEWEPRSCLFHVIQNISQVFFVCSMGGRLSCYFTNG